jgi:hypothetical protein
MIPIQASQMLFQSPPSNHWFIQIYPNSLCSHQWTYKHHSRLLLRNARIDHMDKHSVTPEILQWEGRRTYQESGWGIKIGIRGAEL